MTEAFDMRTRRRPAVVALVVLALVAALAAGVLLGLFAAGGDTGREGVVPEDSVDVGFARAMQTHHEQAVEMSVLVRDATRDPQIRKLALDIELTQQQQVGQMFAWLQMWGYSMASSDPPMDWMKQAGGSGSMSGMAPGSMTGMASGSMPGMASESDLRRLGRLRGEAAERLYLQLMIPHHKAGVSMAGYAMKRAAQPQVRGLAKRIVSAQTAELRALRSLLAARGGPLANG